MKMLAGDAKTKSVIQARFDGMKMVHAERQHPPENAAASHEEEAACADPPADQATGEKSVAGAGRLQSSRFGARRTLSLLWSLVMIGFFVVSGFQVGGLARYVHSVTAKAPPIAQKADGIVVLTGGENRLRTATELLSVGKSERLLITGVNPALTDATLRRELRVDDRLYNCCIDIDREARDTIGNAIAAKRWAEKHDVRSLIVVTSALHMPRALREIGHAVQGVALFAAPVNVPNDQEWWRDSTRVRDILREYAKLVIVGLRDRLNAITGEPWPTMPMLHYIARAERNGDNETALSAESQGLDAADSR